MNGNCFRAVKYIRQGNITARLGKCIHLIEPLSNVRIQMKLLIIALKCQPVDNGQDVVVAIRISTTIYDLLWRLVRLEDMTWIRAPRCFQERYVWFSQSILNCFGNKAVRILTYWIRAVSRANICLSSSFTLGDDGILAFLLLHFLH